MKNLKQLSFQLLNKNATRGLTMIFLLGITVLFLSCVLPKEEGKQPTLGVAETTSTDYKSVLYVPGGKHFSTPTPTTAEVQAMCDFANTVAQSDFNTIIFTYLEVQENNKLTFGNKYFFPFENQPADTTISSYIPDIFYNMKNGIESSFNGTAVDSIGDYNVPEKTFLFSMGGWNDLHSYLLANYPANDVNVLQNIANVCQTYHMDGIDMDYEPYNQYGVTVETLKQTIDSQHPGKFGKGIDLKGVGQTSDSDMIKTMISTLTTYGIDTFTAAPYAGGTCDSTANATPLNWWGGIASNFDWFNVQFYNATTPVSNSDLVCYFNEWMYSSGQTDAFIYPLFTFAKSNYPSASAYKTALDEFSGKITLTGAGVYTSNSVGSNLQSVSTTLQSFLNNQNSQNN